MSKKQISTYKFVPGVAAPAYGEYPNAVALLEANRTFLIEEMDAYVRQQIQLNVAPFTGYSYDTTRSNKCKRDTGYFLDALIYDLTYGGNSLTYQVAARYYLTGIIQILTPAVEVDTHTWLRGKIVSNILTNTTYTRLNSTVTQTVITGNNGEAAGISRATVLANNIISVINSGLSSLPTPVAPNSQSGGLLADAVTLIDLNKRFIQEETIAYIQFNVSNNTPPYLYYTYNAEKCRRDVSYVLEGYISDLKYGGNLKTANNAAKYWENGIAQVDGDRLPEVYAHTFIKDLIENYILTNIAFANRQTLVSQVIDVSYTAETPAATRISELAGTVIDVITYGVSALPTTISNRGSIKFPGFYKQKDLLLITNTDRNVILYNFADPTAGAELTYSTDYDSDFPGALFGNEKITTITLDVDTTYMMVTDNLQIFVEGKEQAVRLNPIATDAMERMKVGIPQSMLDADFEYGLQPTKWQALSLMRGYPSIYEIPNSDIPVTSVITDASSGNIGGVGASLITVTCSAAHGFLVNDPFTIKALANSVSGFSRAEGSFLINSVPTTTTFTYYAKSKVGTNSGDQLSSIYTQVRRGGFYTGSAIGTPAFSVYSEGSSGTITTSLITQSGVDVVGFTGTAPPIGAPLSGTGITSGAQVTAVTGSGGTVASTTLAQSALIGDTTIVVSSTTNLSAGLVFDRGDGVAVLVTSIDGNNVTLSSGLTSAVIGNAQNYIGLSQTSTTGSGTGAQFSIARSGGSYTTTVTSPGEGYLAGDTILVAGTNLGGTAPTNNATITVASASPANIVFNFDNTTLVGGTGYTGAGNVATTGGTGTGLTVNTSDIAGSLTSVTVLDGGSGYTVGDVITIYGTGRVATTGSLVAGSNYSTSSNVSTVGGSGTGLTVNITDDGLGGIASITINNPGLGYTVGNTITIAGGGSYNNVNSSSTTSVAGAGAQLSVTRAAGTGTYSISLTLGGTGYVVGDSVTWAGTLFGGASPANDIVIVVDTVSSGAIVNYTVQGSPVGVPGNSTFTVGSLHTNATIEVLTLTPGGAIQTVTTAGTAITAPTKDFVSAFTMSAVTTAQIASGNTGITYSAIPTIQVVFGSAHGFIPGDTITVQITSSDTGAQLAAGAYFVEQVPNDVTLRYTARASGAIANNLTGFVYARPDSYFVHRPFDGGVQLGTGGPSHGAAAIRMSKKYIRYQSGKGVMYNTGALFAPSYDLRSLTATGTTVGSVITVTTDDTDHGCQVGGTITISGVTTSGYNGNYTVTDIITERIFSVIANKVLGATTAVLGSQSQMSVRTWHGSTIRAGIFDDQNGMFWQYDGQRLAVVKRSSTFQIAGTISIDANSNLVVGTNTRFTQQLAAGDRIVIRGMSHVVSKINNDTNMNVTPDFRGVVNISNVKCVKTVDLQVPQENWNLDTLNGSGQSGYNIDVTKMQMIGIQHTWYGAGFIDFMLRGSDGNYVFAHRFRNSNYNTEAYMRSGNQPVRYEVINEGARDVLSATITDTQTTLPLNNAYWFPTSGTVMVNSELIRYTGNTGTSLTGCTRGTSLTQFVAGSQRSFTGGSASGHGAGSGVVLVSNTITPNISHWGSAFLLDGQFDSDRGYLFNYVAAGVSASVDKVTAFLIRLAPSVSNAQTGDLGEKELLNRAQFLLSSIAITSDTVTGGGGIVVEGVLNPSNYPTDPTKITWTGLGSSAAGGQPSFAQVASGGSVTWSGGASTSTATVQGAFTTTLTAKSFAAATNSLSAIGFLAVTRTATVPALNSGQSSTYQFGVSTSRSDFLIPQATLASYTTPLAVNDPISISGYVFGGQRVSSITQNYITISGTPYARIVMNGVANATSPSNTGLTVTFTSSVAATYATALSTSRTDFLITQAAFASSSLATTDVLSVATYLTGSQGVSSITQNYTTIGGVAYARIIMTAAANATSPSGTNISVTATSAATATYGRALSTSRTDFLATDAQVDAAGIAVGDVLSLATFLTGGQTIQTITRSYISIGGVSHTRIVMSAAANSNSTSGSGNDQTVTVTAAGSAASYTRTNYLFFTSGSWDSSGATIGTKVASDQTSFPAGTSVTAISSRTFGATKVYRVTFTQAANTTINAAGTLKFQFGAQYALPGEQVFSFVNNPGGTDTLNLEPLKELTSTALGGRGAFPNGPDVLAINVYKVSGTATNVNIILRWSEAQA